MRTRSISFMLWLVMLVFARPALATWNAGTGNPVSTAPGDQLVTQTIPDGSGGTYVVWFDGRHGNQDIYLQRLTREGTIAPGFWAPDGIPVCTASSDQNSPVVTSDGAGGVIVAWQDHRYNNDWDIFAQRVNGAGSVQWLVGGVPVSISQYDQTVPSIAPDDAGGCYIAWTDAHGTSTDIWAQHLTSSGSIFPGLLLNGFSVCSAPGPQSEPSVAAANGGFYVTWLDGRSSPTFREIYGMRMNANGTPAWPVNGFPFVPYPGATHQYELASVSDGSNGVIVTFTVPYGTGSVYAQRVAADGTRVWGNWGAYAGGGATQSQPQLISDGAGGAFITWRNTVSIQAIHIGSSGSRGWGGSQVTVGNHCGEDRTPTIIADMSGGMFIGWQQNTTGYPSCGAATTKAHVVRITANGQLATGWPANGIQPASSASLHNNAPRLASDGAGGVFVAWDRSPGGVGQWSTYLQRITGSGFVDVTPPPAVTNLEALGGCNKVTVTWTAPADNGSVVAYRLYRNMTPSPGGTIVPTPTPSSPGSAESVDDNVGTCSAPLYYFLESQDAFGNWSPLSNTAGPAQTLCPQGGCMDLSLAPIPASTFRCRPNPARSQVLFSYAVPNELAGQRELIAIYDVSGRRVAKVSDGSAQRGVREIQWDMRSESGERVAAGVYFARLTLGQKTVSRVIVAMK